MWEYATCDVTEDLGMLNKMGDFGWELVFEFQGKFYFKRRSNWNAQ